MNSSPSTFWANEGDLYRCLWWHAHSHSGVHPLFWNRENSSFSLETDSSVTVVDDCLIAALPVLVAAKSVDIPVIAVVVVVVRLDSSSEATIPTFRFSRREMSCLCDSGITLNSANCCITLCKVTSTSLLRSAWRCTERAFSSNTLFSNTTLRWE
jgi:hypothetical protein